MTLSQDSYGSTTLPPRELRDRVAAALDVAFAEHDSTFWNGTYFRAPGPAGEEICVYDNVEHGDGDEVPFVEHPESVSVVVVSGTRRPAEIGRLLAGVGDLRLLHHGELDPQEPRREPMVHDTYGSAGRDLDAISADVARAVGVGFDVGEDPLRGGTCYTASGPDGEELWVVDNRVLVHGRPYAADHPEMITIVDVRGGGRAAELRERLSAVDGLAPLAHEEI